MDALVLSINGTRRITAELQNEASASVSLSWIGDENNYIFTVEVSRNDHCRMHRWNPIHVNLGDSISFRTTDVIEIDTPNESMTREEQIERVRKQPKMIPNSNHVHPPFEIFGMLDWHVNNTHIFSTQLNNANMVSFVSLWLGDRTGKSMLYLSSDLPPGREKPIIGYGDEVTFYTRRQSRARI